MKEKLMIISDNLNKGLITEYEAKEQLEDLCRGIKSLKQIQRDMFEEWLSTFREQNCLYWFTDSIQCCRHSMREKYNELGIGVY